MKKTLFFAILALTVNAFAQNERTISNIQVPVLNSFENVWGFMIDSEIKTSPGKSGKNLEQGFKYQKLQEHSLHPLNDSIYYWIWDENSLGWVCERKIINIVFDANNNLISESGQNWYNSVWSNIWRFTNTYDANNNLTTEIMQYWNGSIWADINLYSYTYDANNNQISELRQDWNDSLWVNFHLKSYTYDINNKLTSRSFLSDWSGSAWMYGYQSVFTYDANNNLASKLYQTGSGSAWMNLFLDTYTYDANNNQTNDLSREWSGDSWFNRNKWLFVYDANNNQISALRQDWDGSSWTNFSLNTSSYNNNDNITDELQQNWNGSSWVNSNYSVYTYDANNNQTNSIHQSWNGSTWRNSVLGTMTYDANNFIISSSIKEIDSVGAVTSGDSTFYYFHTVLGINDLINPAGSLTIYPNPASTQITVESPATPHGNTVLTISSINGQKIMSCQIKEQQTVIDVSETPPGVYFVKVSDDRTVKVGKFVKQVDK